ncbi:MAG: hypothetical protein M3011_04510, partial [Actinomycetota bacterium]|nr:hypothetical protein [Actinomycetota bacterium]
MTRCAVYVRLPNDRPDETSTERQEAEVTRRFALKWGARRSWASTTGVRGPAIFVAVEGNEDGRPLTMDDG